jgi:DNA-binding GntR family transcriptional regulator
LKGKVNPIKTLTDIERVRDILRKKPRDLLLFDLATQTGLEMKQILNLRVRDLIDSKIGSRLILPQPGGNPPRAILITWTLYQTWQNYLKETAPSPNDYLIKSQKNSQPPTLSSVSHMINKWFKAANLEGAKGAKSLKRTWQVFYQPELEETTEKEGIQVPIHGSKQVMDPVGPISTIQEKVHDKLFQAIISGRIPPGEKLVIDKIASQMKVSRIPVREASHRLHEAGLISIDKWKGAIVNKLSIEDLREITVVRLMLESKAAELAAIKCRKETLERLWEIHEKWKRSITRLNRNDLQTVENFLKLNRQFHNLIYREARMPILFQIINGLWDKVSPYLHILVAGGIKGAVSDDTIRIHKGLLDGMKVRSGKDVSRWLKKDLIHAEKSIMTFFKSR